MVVQRMIRIEGLTKRFGERLVFADVDMDIAAGRCVGVYGPSGIGKSTLAKILCGVLRPDAGAIHMDGKPLYAADAPYDRRLGLRIQMVYQQPYAALDFNQKIINGFLELIRYHRFAQGRAASMALIEGLMDEVGLEMDILNHLPHQISGGEAQRIALARCLLFEPRLLILDEATSMLDVSTQANVLALTRRVAEKSGGAILLISHDRELVDFMCDQIYVFADTKLYEEK